MILSSRESIYFSEQAVACPRCCDRMCGCPRSNKFLLEWHTEAEIEATLELTRAYIAQLKEPIANGAVDAAISSNVADTSADTGHTSITEVGTVVSFE